MPQMSPLMWFILFLLFTSTLLISLMKIYFNTQKQTSNKNNEMLLKHQMSPNWKW